MLLPALEADVEGLVRERLGVVHDLERGAIRAAAEVKNNPPDLIGVALEMLVKASTRPVTQPTVHAGGP